jgi:hypothetical protein
VTLLRSRIRPGCEQREGLPGTGVGLRLPSMASGQRRPALGAAVLAAAAVLGGLPELQAQPAPAPPQRPPSSASPVLTVRVTATPAAAAERLEEIRRTHGVTLTVILRAEGWIPRVGPKGRDFVITPDAPPEATFRELEWNKDYSIGVAVWDPKIAPRWKPVRIHEARQTESVVIPFREFDVEARPDFGLYASHLPQRLRTVRGFIRDPQNFVARSGSDVTRTRGRYFLETKGAHIRFFFWDVKLVHTLLTPVETGESTQTVVLAVDNDRLEPYEVPRYRTGPFGEIWLQAFPLRESRP